MDSKKLFIKDEIDQADYIKKRQNFWTTLKLLRKEFLEKENSFDAYKFTDYVADNYGIQINIIEGNYFGGTYSIIDQQKYLVYLLKFN